jgi:hypothetical protein
MPAARLIVLCSFADQHQHFLENQERKVQTVIGASSVVIRGFIAALRPLSIYSQIPTPSGPLPISNQD